MKKKCKDYCNKTGCFQPLPIKGKRHQTYFGNNYKRYLKSSWWKKRRKLAIYEANNRCEQCLIEDTIFKKNQFYVTHLHYNRLYREKREDLLVLCENCFKSRRAAIQEMESHLDSIVGKS